MLNASKQKRPEITKLLIDQNLNLIPILPKTKDHPAIKWKIYQNEKYNAEIPIHYNIGIVLGIISGNSIVVDLDSYELTEEFKEYLSKTLVVKTSKGWHIYFKVDGKLPNTLRLINKKNQRVDVQSSGTYTLAPSSIHPDGTEYEIISSTTKIANIDFKIISAKLSNLGFKPDASSLPIDVIKRGVPLGMRDNSGFYLARDLLKKGKNEDEVIKELKEWNEKNDPPMDPEQVIKLVKQSQKYVYRKKPSLLEVQKILSDSGRTHTDYAYEILDSFSFRTLTNTNQILVYQDGIYKFGGELVIKQECQRRIPNCSRYMCSEVIETIKRVTYTDPEKFNSNSSLINVKNGIINIETGELISHTPAKLFRNQIPVKYDPNAGPVKIMKFFIECLPDPNDRLDVIEEMASCIVPNLKLEKMYHWLGLGDNGKSTASELLQTLLGKNNVSNISIHDLIRNRFFSAELDGKLANIYADISSLEIGEMGKLKPLISGDLIDADRKGIPPFKIKNKARMFFSSNELPKINENNYGAFKRIMITKWLIQHDRTKQDPHLLEKLTTDEELSGLLNLLLYHAKKLLKRGRFSNEQSVEQVKTEWKEKQDVIDIYIKERLIIKPDGIVPKTQLYADYKKWCITKKFQSKGRKTFQMLLQDKTKVSESMPKINGITTRVWSGLCISDKIDCGKGGKCGNEQ